MPTEGQPHPQFAGCLWSSAFQDWACDDGYLLVSGAPWVGDGALTVPGTTTGGNTGWNGLAEGQPHAQFPGCLWSVTAQDWACDDGYYLTSGAPVGGAQISGDIGPGRGGDPGGGPGFWDRLASDLGFFNPGDSRSPLNTVANASAEAIAAAERAAEAGGAAARDALKFLADNGNLFAKLALLLGLSLSAATAVAIGGGAIGGILLLKVLYGRR